MYKLIAAFAVATWGISPLATISLCRAQTYPYTPAQPPTTAPTTQPLPTVAVENLADHPVEKLGFESRDGEVIDKVGACGPRSSIPPHATPFDPREFLRVSFVGPDGKTHLAEFTRPDYFCSGPAQRLYVYIGHDDQILVRAIVRSDYQDLDRWHVPDDRVGYIRPEAMKQPQLIGIGRRDTFFDLAIALIRYPSYDELRLVRPGNFLGGPGEEMVCGGKPVRQLPAADFLRVERVADDSITFAGPHGPFTVNWAGDDPPVPGRPAMPTPVRIRPAAPPAANPPNPLALLDPFGLLRVPAAIAAQALSPEISHQEIGVSNWSAANITGFKIDAGGKEYVWGFDPIRPGGGDSSETGQLEVLVQGKVQVTYFDGTGHLQKEVFQDVPKEASDKYPNRDFYFDAGGKVLLHCFDLTMEGKQHETWCVPDSQERPEIKIKLPELLGTAPVPSMTGVWNALVRYPGIKDIDTYSDGDMLGGSKTDIVSHETANGNPRYRIESILPDRIVLIRNGERITIKIKDG